MADTTHGSPWDRGGADSHYGRRRNPHKRDAMSNDIYDLTEDEIKQYHEGYDFNEKYGDKKYWGIDEIDECFDYDSDCEKEE